VPIYEYKCTKCGEVFEAFQRINDAPLTSCKFCNAKVEKLISQSSFQLKGSGWYLTDYGRKESPAGDTASKPPKPAEKAPGAKETPAAAPAKSEKG
jgi:putative FmdB family regulatory protein